MHNQVRGWTLVRPPYCRGGGELQTRHRRWFAVRVRSWLLRSLGALLCLCTVGVFSALADEQVLRDLVADAAAASVLLVEPSGNVSIALNADEGLIPASTAKLALAHLVLQEWDLNHRFETRFLVENLVREGDSSARLWVAASGDPFLVSEQLNTLAEGLARALRNVDVERIEEFGVDTSLFARLEDVPGGTRTANPYDAVPSALAANFNTVLLRMEDDQVVQAEAQTPVTAITQLRARELAGSETGAALRQGVDLRVNLGSDAKDRSARYFVELLSYFLKEYGIDVPDDSSVISGTAQGRDVWSFQTTQRLEDTLRGMLRFSNNFIANQLALVWAATVSYEPADFSAFATNAAQALQSTFLWQDFRLDEGAGLSRDNRLSARQLVELLASFDAEPELLPRHRTGVWAKTGTLTGVSTLAGVIDASALSGGSRSLSSTWRFALMINDESVEGVDWREYVLDLLVKRVREQAEAH